MYFFIQFLLRYLPPLPKPGDSLYIELFNEYSDFRGPESHFSFKFIELFCVGGRAGGFGESILCSLVDAVVALAAKTNTIDYAQSGRDGANSGPTCACDDGCIRAAQVSLIHGISRPFSLIYIIMTAVESASLIC